MYQVYYDEESPELSDKKRRTKHQQSAIKEAEEDEEDDIQRRSRLKIQQQQNRYQEAPQQKTKQDYNSSKQQDNASTQRQTKQQQQQRKQIPQQQDREEMPHQYQQQQHRKQQQQNQQEQYHDSEDDEVEQSLDVIPGYTIYLVQFVICLLQERDFTVDDEDIYRRRKPTEDQQSAFKDNKSYLNVMADDSASQMNQQSSNQAQSMRGNPFTSNLEQARMLAQLTKERVNALNLEQNDQRIDYGDGAKLFLEYQKTNKYLSGALKHLNLTIDVLLEQYNPSNQAQSHKIK